MLLALGSERVKLALDRMQIAFQTPEFLEGLVDLCLQRL